MHISLCYVRLPDFYLFNFVFCLVSVDSKGGKMTDDSLSHQQLMPQLLAVVGESQTPRVQTNFFFFWSIMCGFGVCVLNFTRWDGDVEILEHLS